MRIELGIIKIILVFSILLSFQLCKTLEIQKSKVIITKDVLLDKIKGGWAGQTIGCTYGGPTEFKWNGTFIDQSVPILWNDTRIPWCYENAPGLYDDVYMDLTFVDVFEKYGIDAPDSLHALAFAKAEYRLWHANQAARYNVLNGIMPPLSGYWKNNPHSEDIDFQIEADFAGLMSPGMINSAVQIADKIGHITNYGDGFYGGVYVASMYSLAFVYNDIEYIVEKALEPIPSKSNFHRCISDVIKWYKQNPNDWRYTWFEVQKKWTHDIGCPHGVFSSYNIDAKINAAYVVIGLLYGKGDYGATIDISTRCGCDSDCNPANAAGILGTMIGYSNIPNHWKQGLDKVENLNFAYTDMSLNKVYETSYKHAMEMIIRNGGKEYKNEVLINYQRNIQTIPLEIGFEGLYPIERKNIKSILTKQINEFFFDIKGSGFVINGSFSARQNQLNETFEIDLYIDDVFIETIKMPTLFRTRRQEIAWNYDLTEKNHAITLKSKYIPEGSSINIEDVIVYSSKKPIVNYSTFASSLPRLQ